MKYYIPLLSSTDPRRNINPPLLEKEIPDDEIDFALLQNGWKKHKRRFRNEVRIYFTKVEKNT
jgi:hypothetical protein